MTVSARSWRIFEGLAGTAAAGALVAGLYVWRDSFAQGEALEVHGIELVELDGRVDTLEAGAGVVLLAQAERRLEKLENGAEQVTENAKAIAVVQAEQRSQADSLKRIENAQADTNVALREVLQRLPRRASASAVGAAP